MVLLASLAIRGQNKEERKILSSIEGRADTYESISLKIWDLAEVGYKEVESSKLLQDELRANGFEVESGVAGIPTAFVASYGSGGPSIGILAEFDALPGVSQEAIPEKKERIPGGAGHACGHHLFGTGSMAAAIAVKEWLENTGSLGTIQLLGTPAEEGGAGKVYMVREGLMDNLDAVLHWHPSSQNDAGARSSLANKSAKFRFYGNASHAAIAPERGRSALDAVEAMNFMVNMMREHVQMESRIHYVITSGGEAPNVVPAYAEVYYYVRHPEMQEVKAMFDRIVKAAEGAALGTGTTMEYEVIHGIYNVLPNEVLSQVMYDKMNLVGGITYDESEIDFARQILSSYEGSPDMLSIGNTINDFKVQTRGSGGSTDVGDVSWMVPTAGIGTATWVPGTSAHSWQAVAAGGMSIGQKGMQMAAKTIALSAVHLFKNQEVLKRAKGELLDRRGSEFKYEALLGDRKPPLNYRD